MAKKKNPKNATPELTPTENQELTPIKPGKKEPKNKKQPKTKEPKQKKPVKEPKQKKAKKTKKRKNAFVLEGKFDRRLVFDVDGTIKLETHDGFINIDPEKILSIVVRKRGIFRRELAISVLDKEKRDAMQINGINIWLLVAEKGNRKKLTEFFKLCREHGILVCKNEGYCDENYIESTFGGAATFIKITDDKKVIYCHFGVPTYLCATSTEIHLRKSCIWWYASGEKKGFTSVEPKKKFRAKLPKFAENLKKLGFKVVE